MFICEEQLYMRQSVFYQRKSYADLQRAIKTWLKNNNMPEVSTSLKLKLSRGNIKAVQGDTGHAEARMVTDTYAHGFDEDRKLIAKEMDSGFFSKVGDKKVADPLTDDTLEKLKLLIQEHPELLNELLAKSSR